MDTEIKPIDILYVEDSPSDVKMTEYALKECKMANTLNVVRDGEEALNYLYKRNGFEETTRPDIILLDLNLPKVDGREVLDIVKNDSHLRQIPIVILTTSDAEEDIAKSYNLNVNCYIQKPVDIEKFVEVVKSIENFWFSIVTLPKKEKG